MKLFKRKKRPVYAVYALDKDGNVSYIYETKHIKLAHDADLVKKNEELGYQTEIDTFVGDDWIDREVLGRPEWLIAQERQQQMEMEAKYKAEWEAKNKKTYPRGKAYADYILRELGVPEEKWNPEYKKKKQNEEFMKNIFDNSQPEI